MNLKSKISSILIVITIQCCSNYENVKMIPTLQKDGINGKVHYINHVLNDHLSFDSVGVIIYEFNPHGYIISEKTIYKGQESNLIRYEYDKKNLLIKKEYGQKDNPYMDKKFFYNKSNHLKKIILHQDYADADITYFNDSKGRVIEEKSESTTGVETRTLNFYDNDNLIETINFRGEEKTSITTYKYDLDSMKKDVVWTNFKGDWRKHTYYYTNDNLTKKKLYYFGLDSIIATEFYKYDSSNRLIERKVINHDTKTINYFITEYISDDKNNWVKETQFKGDSIININKRILEYYE